MMNQKFDKIINGYQVFKKTYATGEHSMMQQLSQGQEPEIMVIACCDSRVDPSIILQCDPGDLFVVRNVANIVPPYEADEYHHGTSAALEFGICHLNIKHMVILGHSNCGGIHALLDQPALKQNNDFISRWVSIIKDDNPETDPNNFAKQALQRSYENCLTFPWLKQRLDSGELTINLWYFEVKEGELFNYSFDKSAFEPLANQTR